MTRAVWVKADDTVGDWDDRRARITAALEAGADWVLVDEDDVERVHELGDINVAAFRTDGNVTLVDDIDEAEDETGDAATRADAIVVGKNGEGDATIDLPEDFSGSADLSTLRRDGDFDRGAYVRILGTEYAQPDSERQSARTRDQQLRTAVQRDDAGRQQEEKKRGSGEHGVGYSSRA